MRALLIILLSLIIISPVHAERTGVEIVAAGWGDSGTSEAFPGDENIPLVIKIKNVDAYDLGALRCTLSFSPPLYFEYLDNGSRVKQSFQKLTLGDLRTNATATLRYTMSIDERAEPGIYRAELEVVYINDLVRRDVFPVYLRISSPSKLVVENLSLKPEVPHPGDVVSAEITLKNAGKSRLSQIQSELMLKEPFIPVGFGNIKYIHALDTGESSKLKFSFRVNGDAESGGYTIPLLIYYRGPSGKALTENFSLGILISSPSDFRIDSLKFTPGAELKEGVPSLPCCRDVELEFDVVNAAGSEARFVEVSIEHGKSYHTYPDRVYIGTLSPDDFSSVKFTLKFSGDTGFVKIPVKIGYTDKNNIKREVQKYIEIYVEEKSDSSKKNSEGILSRFFRWLLGF